MAALAAPLIMGMTAVGGAASQANAMRAQGAYQAQVAKTNAALGEQRAQDAVDRGQQTANAVRRKANAIAAEGRLEAGANGNSGGQDAADLALETKLASSEDITTAKTNAWAEAWGFKTEASNAAFQGKFAQLAADNNAESTILTGGMKALGDITSGIAKSKTGKRKTSDPASSSQAGGDDTDSSGGLA